MAIHGPARLWLCPLGCRGYGTDPKNGPNGAAAIFPATAAATNAAGASAAASSTRSSPNTARSWWVGRAINDEQKERDYQQLSPAERSGKEPPANLRFPKQFHRSVELFGQHASRLKVPGYREFIQQHGLILVEGFHDVINLNNLGIPSHAIMSNRMTEAQGKKMLRFTKQFGIDRVD